MTLTKSRHNLGRLLALLFYTGAAAASDPYSCVRDLMPITELAAHQVHRSGVEKPFTLLQKYIVFPEVTRGRLSGFFVYSDDKAWYYDSVEGGQRLSDLKESDLKMYDLVAQPNGLETLTISYLPGYRMGKSIRGGPVVLGASVLPVFGAVISPSNRDLRMVYHNPSDSSEDELKEWFYSHASRKPASVKDVQVRRQLLHLATLAPKRGEKLWEPLRAELKVRKAWVKTHNVDEASFRKLARLMDTTCRE